MNYIQSLHSEPAFRAKMRSKADARCQSTRQQEINMHECYQFEWQQSIDTRTMDMPLHKNTDDSMTESTYFKMIDQDYVANQMVYCKGSDVMESFLASKGTYYGDM
eukprot:75376_1